MTLAMGGDGPVLPRELARERVDLRLTLSRQRSKGRAIAPQNHACDRRVASPIALPPLPRSRDQRGRAARDLPVYQLELALDLPARFLHPRKRRDGLSQDRHDEIPRCQPMKLEAPA